MASCIDPAEKLKTTKGMAKELFPVSFTVGEAGSRPVDGIVPLGKVERGEGRPVRLCIRGWAWTATRPTTIYKTSHMFLVSAFYSSLAYPSTCSCIWLIMICGCLILLFIFSWGIRTDPWGEEAMPLCLSPPF